MKLSHSMLSLYLLLGLAACGDDKSVKSEDDAPEQTDSDPVMNTDPVMDSDDDEQLQADLIVKLKECQVYEPATAPDNVDDEFGRCLADCLVAATCEDLKELFCSAIPSESSPALNCVATCPFAPSDGFACHNGSKVPRSFQCDGEDDCPFGEDETGCEPHRCEDGEEIDVSNLACDGFEDCGDGSDEVGCANICG